MRFILVKKTRWIQIYKLIEKIYGQYLIKELVQS